MADCMVLLNKNEWLGSLGQTNTNLRKLDQMVGCECCIVFWGKDKWSWEDMFGRYEYAHEVVKCKILGVKSCLPYGKTRLSDELIDNINNRNMQSLSIQFQLREELDSFQAQFLPPIPICPFDVTVKQDGDECVATKTSMEDRLGVLWTNRGHPIASQSVIKLFFAPACISTLFLVFDKDIPEEMDMRSYETDC